MKVIAIDREFGAGGHTVGKAVAAKLGIEFYDKDIIQQAAAMSGITPAEVENEEEVLSRGDSILSALMPTSFDIKDVVFQNERKAIISLASQGPCVVLGRCASAILKEEGIDAVTVFLHASKDVRAHRVMKILGIDDVPAAFAAMKHMDAKRRYYYERYTDHHWAEMGGYTLCFDTSAVTVDVCTDAICAAACADKPSA